MSLNELRILCAEKDLPEVHSAQIPKPHISIEVKTTGNDIKVPRNLQNTTTKPPNNRARSVGSGLVVFTASSIVVQVPFTKYSNTQAIEPFPKLP